MIVLSHINVLVFWGGDSNMPFDFEKNWRDYDNVLIYSILWIFHFFFGFLGNFIDLFRIFVGDLITKVLINLWLYIGIRAITPRIRFDHLMQFGWQIILPFQLGLLWFYTGYFTI
jgi:NADH:ubiquinone oxidoreductase subunit H